MNGTEEGSKEDLVCQLAETLVWMHNADQVPYETVKEYIVNIGSDDECLSEEVYELYLMKITPAALTLQNRINGKES